MIFQIKFLLGTFVYIFRLPNFQVRLVRNHTPENRFGIVTCTGERKTVYFRINVPLDFLLLFSGMQNSLNNNKRRTNIEYQRTFNRRQKQFILHRLLSYLVHIALISKSLEAAG